MSWQRRKPYKGKYTEYSISRKLRKDGKSNDEFEVMLANLPMEDLIALKLELSVKPVNNRLYGIPLWYTLPEIVKEAMAFIGLPEVKFYSLKNKYGIERFFEGE